MIKSVVKLALLSSLTLADDSSAYHPTVENVGDTNMLDLLLYYFPFLLPNNSGDHSGRHAVDKGHLVSHDFRMSF